MHTRVVVGSRTITARFWVRPQAGTAARSWLWPQGSAAARSWLRPQAGTAARSWLRPQGSAAARSWLRPQGSAVRSWPRRQACAGWRLRLGTGAAAGCCLRDSARWAVAEAGASLAGLDAFKPGASPAGLDAFKPGASFAFRPARVGGRTRQGACAKARKASIPGSKRGGARHAFAEERAADRGPAASTPQVCRRSRRGGGAWRLRHFVFVEGRGWKSYHRHPCFGESGACPAGPILARS